MPTKKIFSGIQPSGNLHLGNYLGAIRNWVGLQEKYESIFCIVDLHAITVSQEPNKLREKTIEVAKTYLAAGINPRKSTIFVQSDIPAHSELMWLLNTISKTGELFKMTQFKDKTNQKNQSPISVSTGLLNYPILMAADILLYDTDIVPVGEDQLQHVELSRTLARRFNETFGETFNIPKPHVKKEGMRIMGLDNPQNKMSKSAPSKYNRIDLLDSPDQIREKISKAVTDSETVISYNKNRPAIHNLLNIFGLVTNQIPAKVAEQYSNKGYQEFKESLAKAIIKYLAPFQKKYHETPDSDVKMILKEGAEKLEPLTKEKIKQVKKRMGLGLQF